jgi:hypothetical protein
LEEESNLNPWVEITSLLFRWSHHRGFFFPPILWGWWTGDHPQEDLAKFVYKFYKVELFWKPIIYILATWKNLWSKYYMVISTLFFFGLKTSLDFGGIIFPPKKTSFVQVQGWYGDLACYW